jgi:hypothetical protein
MCNINFPLIFYLSRLDILLQLGISFPYSGWSKCKLDYPYNFSISAMHVCASQILDSIVNLQIKWQLCSKGWIWVRDLSSYLSILGMSNIDLQKMVLMALVISVYKKWNFSLSSMCNFLLLQKSLGYIAHSFQFFTCMSRCFFRPLKGMAGYIMFAGIDADG